jgi:hypothetical protein
MLLELYGVEKYGYHECASLLLRARYYVQERKYGQFVGSLRWHYHDRMGLRPYTTVPGRYAWV